MTSSTRPHDGGDLGFQTDPFDATQADGVLAQSVAPEAALSLTRVTSWVRTRRHWVAVTLAGVGGHRAPVLPSVYGTDVFDTGPILRRTTHEAILTGPLDLFAVLHLVVLDPLVVLRE